MSSYSFTPRFQYPSHLQEGNQSNFLTLIATLGLFLRAYDELEKMPNFTSGDSNDEHTFYT